MKPIMQRMHHYQRGVAAVEFALVLIPLLMVAFGIVEFGRAIYTYDTLVKSVRGAVRLVSQYDPTNTKQYAEIKDQARCIAVYGKADCNTKTDTPLVKGIAFSNVKICDKVSVADCSDLQSTDLKDVSTGSGTDKINLVVVRIDGYVFNFLGLPFTGAASSMEFGRVQSQMRGL